jgi:hypothetical protein
MKERTYRVLGAIMWLFFVGGFFEMSYKTATITGVWIYSLFFFLILAAIVGSCVILFLGRDETTNK